MIIGYTVLTLIISIAYVCLIIYILDQWTNIDVSDGDKSIAASTDPLKLSFIIPARNEDSTIAACLNSVLANIETNGIEAEVIVINDHSEDNTIAQVESIANKHSCIKLIHLAALLSPGDKINAYKKIALSHALRMATGDYMIQLDADVILPSSYLKGVIATINVSQADLIAAPVLFKSDGSRFQNFQSLDMMGMMAVTAAGIASKKWYMANGANMIYKKGSVSYQDEELASGDDVSAIQCIANKKGSKIIFLKDLASTVTTQCESDSKSFYNQRIRWGTKNKQMSGGTMRLMMGIPYVHVIWLLLHVVFFFLLGPTVLLLGAFQLLSKLGIDYIYLKTLSGFFGEVSCMKSFWYSSAGHLIYIAVIGTMSLVIRKYSWKGREVT